MAEPISSNHSAPVLPLEPGIERVLVVQANHHLGNTVLSLPAIAALASHFERGIDLLIDERWKNLAARIEGVNTIHAYPAQRDGFGHSRAAIGKIVALTARMLRVRYRAVISLTGGMRSPLITLGTLAPVRIGIRGTRRAWCYTRLIDPPERPEGQAHAIERYNDMLACIGHDGPAPLVKIEPSPASAARVRGELEGLWPDGDGPLVVLHPSAGIRWRCWPTERFAHVAQALIERRGVRVLIVGVEGDRDLADEIILGVRERERVRFVTWPLEDLIAVLDRADLLVSNESGPTHLAASIGTPIVTIFGPSDERKWAPKSVEPGSLTILRGDACDPGCAGRTCVAEMRCLTSLDAERVAVEALATLDRSGPTASAGSRNETSVV